MKTFAPSRRAILVTIGTTAVLFFALVTLWLRPGTSADRTGSPPPDLPAFEGEAVTVQFDGSALVGRPAQITAANQEGWTPVLTEDWEDGFDTDKWVTIDGNGTTNGEYKWDTRPFENTINNESQLSAWGIGGGADGESLDPEDDSYPANVQSWLMYGPVDMSDAVDAQLTFNYWFEADADDSFSVLV
jgi:hypothetical protein